jgi:F-type H+-transporting ATPase subunit b
MDWLTATETAFIALLLFLALLIYLKVPQQVAGALDSRSQAIAKELREARKLREDAETLLVEYEAKRAAAEAEAQAIVEAAKEQAARVAEETRSSMLAAMQRREREAEERIAQAEARAANEVRAAAAEAAIAAAERMIRERMNEQAQAALVRAAAGELERKFG